jgi:hypothetical protein
MNKGKINSSKTGWNIQSEQNQRRNRAYSLEKSFIVHHAQKPDRESARVRLQRTIMGYSLQPICPVHINLHAGAWLI